MPDSAWKCWVATSAVVFSVGSVGDNLYFNSNSLQWRYAILENPWISSINAGFISSNGLMSRSIIGAGISNDPIEPRRLFESYVIDGNYRA
jgi:hypothetical protein